MAYLHILVVFLAVGTTTLLAATINLQQSSTDFTFEDDEGQIHHEHLVVDEEHDKQVIELDGDEDHAPATFVFEYQRCLLGVFDPSAGEAGECYLVPGLESDSGDQKVEEFSEENLSTEQLEEDGVLLFKRSSNTSATDHSALSPELQSVCADKPLYWGQQVQGSPNDTVTEEAPSTTEIHHPRQKRGIFRCVFGGYKCYRTWKTRCFCRRRCCIPYKVLVCGWHIITGCRSDND